MNCIASICFGHGCHLCVFLVVQILSAGEGPYLYHSLVGGKVKAQIPCTPPSLNTLALNEHPSEPRVSVCVCLCVWLTTLILLCFVNGAWLEKSHISFQVLTLGGSSAHIDVFTNLSYRAFSLSFWKNPKRVLTTPLLLIDVKIGLWYWCLLPIFICNKMFPFSDVYWVIMYMSNCILLMITCKVCNEIVGDRP